ELRKFRNLPPYFEIWDVEGKKLLVTFKSSKDPVVEVQDATLSSDGKTAIIVERFPVKPIAATDPAWDYRVVFCDVVTGKRTRTLASLSGPVALSPDSKLLAAHPWKEFDKLLLVDANTGETRVTLAHPAHPKEDRMFPWSPYEFHFAPNGKYLAGRGSLSNYGRGWVVWDLEGKILLGQEYPSQPTTLCFLPEVDRNGREWLSYKDWFRPRPLREERADENVKAITISPDGKLVAVGERGAIRVWSHSLPE